MPWSDPDVEKFRADLVAVIQHHQAIIAAPALFAAANDIVQRLTMPDAPFPEATPPPPPETPLGTSARR